MSVSEPEQAQLAQSERRMVITIDCGAIVKHGSAKRDIMRPDEEETEWDLH